MERRSAARVPWEIFRGHLLEAAHSRETIVADTWSVFLDDADAPASVPLLSVLWESEHDCLHVVRQILTYGFEAYEDSPGVILARDVEKWVPEFVGTLDAKQSAHDLSSELSQDVFLAVIGTSRLPITSLESPLPAFSLGQLAYLPFDFQRQAAWDDAIDFASAAFASDQALVQAKALEIALRAVPDHELERLTQLCEQQLARPAGRERLIVVFRSLFNNVALSPYTTFVERLLWLLCELSSERRLGPAAVVDLLSFMLRHLCRHLTAFDLTTFHNFGANYPDALFLDALLKAYLGLAERHADLWLDAPGQSAAEVRLRHLRRRALRQACLVRRAYESHWVPDAPTSMGEQRRVLPAAYARVPEEQIRQVAARRRKLFADDPLEDVLDDIGRRLLAASLADLAIEDELYELGLAHFLARPWGIALESGAVDRTPLLAYEAHSRTIALSRLDQLQLWGWITNDERDAHAVRIRAATVDGLLISQVDAVERPGVVSLADVAARAADFTLLRTARHSLATVISRYDLEPLIQAAPDTAAWLGGQEPKTLVSAEPLRSPVVTLRFYDRLARLRLELGFGAPLQTIYRQRCASELVERLQVLRVGETDQGGAWRVRELSSQDIWIELR
ncbi:MAG TPA: hypothetical protein VHV08_08435 [Pirellulales bacterium]|nr:hypothetical protein [Pirellulales bacterium]